MQIETYALQHYDRYRCEVDAAIEARRAVFIEMPEDEFNRITNAVQVDANPPRTLAGRITSFIRLPRLLRGEIGTFWVIYMLAKRYRMNARPESLDGKLGFLFTPR